MKPSFLTCDSSDARSFSKDSSKLLVFSEAAAMMLGAQSGDEQIKTTQARIVRAHFRRATEIQKYHWCPPQHAVRCPLEGATRRVERVKSTFSHDSENDAGALPNIISGFKSRMAQQYFDCRPQP